MVFAGLRPTRVVFAGLRPTRVVFAGLRPTRVVFAGLRPTKSVESRLGYAPSSRLAEWASFDPAQDRPGSPLCDNLFPGQNTGLTSQEVIIHWQCVLGFAYSLLWEHATEKLEGNTLELSVERVLDVLKALASAGRMDILRVLGAGRHNITQIAKLTGQPQPTVTQNIKRLQQAGLVEATLRPVPQGHEKLCTRLYDNIVIRFPGDGLPCEHNVSEVSMPVGMYKGFDVRPPCGLVTASDMIGLLDDPQSFNDPRHVFAQLVWFADGYVEYTFPVRVPPGNVITSLELSAELCSEAPGHDAHHPSDITVWINEREIGTWVCPGDFGDYRGRLTPSWWPSRYTQYGLLKHWRVNSSGAFLDGSRLSTARLGDVGLRPGYPIRVRLGIREDAERKGGINLFGSKFGNYGQDLVLRVEFEPETTRRSAQ